MRVGTPRMSIVVISNRAPGAVSASWTSDIDIAGQEAAGWVAKGELSEERVCFGQG
jgi:hypothetical protein